MEKIDGGPAFPQHPEQAYEGVNFQGMSLRDYFAGMALSIAGDDVGGFEWEERTAENAYKLADAMLKERDK